MADLELEMALDLVEGELATELPAHMRAFARAHASGRPPPPAPAIATRDTTLELARRAAGDDEIAARGLALLRLIAPLAIESAPAVAVARAAPVSWDGLRRLAEARDAVARARFGCGAIELAHRLYGVVDARARADAPPGPAIAGWTERAGTFEPEAVDALWQRIAARLAVPGRVRIEPSASAQPRAFCVEPRREVIVVVPRELDRPSARFAVLHELGHAVAALGLAPGVPRVVDEAAAAYVGRWLEVPGVVPAAWTSELAGAARARRRALAAALDRIERALPVLDETPAYAPTWGLWHDPGAQGAYVTAEAIADRLHDALGPAPAGGGLLGALSDERARIDGAARARGWA